MAFGLTSDGFTPKSLNDTKAEQELALQGAFGPNINLEPSSVFGQLVGIYSEQAADVWALLLAVYWTQYPDTANGVALDRICAINNIERQPATATQTTALLKGTDGTTVPAASAATDTANNRVYSLAAAVELDKAAATAARVTVATVEADDYTVTIDGTPYTYSAGGSDTVGDILAGLQPLLNAISGITATTLNEGVELAADTLGSTFSIAVTANLTLASVGSVGTFIANEAGPTPLPAEALTEINTPVAGWASVTNPQAGIVGQLRETDESLRLRRQRARDNDLLGALENLPNVTDARTVFNEGTTTNSDGVPRQHLWAIVEGGTGEDIVATIAQYKAAGIGTYGALEATTTSPVSGELVTYKYQRPTYLEPDIEVTYTITGDFPPDGEALITQALVAYGQSLRIGDSLHYSRLFTPINTVAGMTVEITIDADTDDIVAGTDDKIRLLASNITVVEAS